MQRQKKKNPFGYDDVNIKLPQMDPIVKLDEHNPFDEHSDEIIIKDKVTNPFDNIKGGAPSGNNNNPFESDDDSDSD